MPVSSAETRATVRLAIAPSSPANAGGGRAAAAGSCVESRTPSRGRRPVWSSSSLIAFLVRRPWSAAGNADTPTDGGSDGAAAAADRGAAAARQAAGARSDRTGPAASGRPAGRRSSVPASKPPASSPAPAAITLATAQLCRTLSTGGANWRCDPAADPVSPGPILLYTRVRSPRDAVVVHRWYRRGALRQSVKLPIRASATEGYRTYSRQTVDAERTGAWKSAARKATCCTSGASPCDDRDGRCDEHRSSRRVPARAGVLK